METTAPNAAPASGSAESHGRLLPGPEAWQRLDRFLRPLPAQRIERLRALDRVLAAPLCARVDVPALDVSAMDGFALAGETPGGGGEGSGVRLPVVGTVAAGDAPGAELPAGSALRIFTGAPVPAGADRVVIVESTVPVSEEDGAVDAARDAAHEEILVQAWPAAGANIRRRGEVLTAGAGLLGQGALVTPGGLGLLATHGYGEVPIHRPPRVALLPTGDEVVPPEQEPAPGQLRDSHTDFLLGAGVSLGLRFFPLGIAPDEPERLRELIRQGLHYDVLVLTGGVSVGERDLVAGMLRELGCEILFRRLAIQPAKPVLAAVHGGGLVFGLPGNPASAMVGFWLFVRPALRRLMGYKDGYLEGVLQGELMAPLPGAKGRDRFLPSRIAFRAGRLEVTPVPPVGSHDVAAYACGTALARIPAHAKPKSAGEMCEVLPLVDWRSG